MEPNCHVYSGEEYLTYYDYNGARYYTPWKSPLRGQGNAVG